MEKDVIRPCPGCENRKGHILHHMLEKRYKKMIEEVGGKVE